MVQDLLVEVVLAGEGSEASEIDKLGLSNVHRLGNLAQPDLSSLLSQSALFCLPTRSEGFCTALLEAGAWGVPAVIPRVGGFDEVLGAPAARGVELSARDPLHVAAGIREALPLAANESVRTALREHVENTCSWEQTAVALRTAFEMTDSEQL